MSAYSWWKLPTPGPWPDERHVTAKLDRRLRFYWQRGPFSSWLTKKNALRRSGRFLRCEAVDCVGRADAHDPATHYRNHKPVKKIIANHTPDTALNSKRVRGSKRSERSYRSTLEMR